MRIYIRNMACESCKILVQDTLSKLKIPAVRVELGHADLKKKISAEKKKAINREIGKAGLQIAENTNAILVEKIRKCIFDYIDLRQKPAVNFSEYLIKCLGYDYNYLSSLFSEIEATTITYYMNSLKAERIKEMILFEDLTLSEIADKMHFNSLSHFSSQFKKITGFAPSHFKKLKDRRRLTLQELNNGTNSKSKGKVK